MIHSRDTPLNAEGVTILRGINGVLGFAAQGRPDVCGRSSISASKVGKGPVTGEAPTWKAIYEANGHLQFLKDTNASSQLWYPVLPNGPETLNPLTGTNMFRLLVFSDSAFINMNEKRSLGAYMILLVPLSNEYFGRQCHILEFASRKSTRVAKSTYMAELLSAVQAIERAQLSSLWLSEIFYGHQRTCAIKDMPQQFEIELVIDCRGLFDSLAAAGLSKLTDKGAILYLMWLRDEIANNRLNSIMWVPTESMLVDEMAKVMEPNGLLEELFRNGTWHPVSRPGLPEDLMTFRDGVCLRWRVS